MTPEEMVYGYAIIRRFGNREFYGKELDLYIKHMLKQKEIVRRVSDDLEDLVTDGEDA